MHFLIIFIRLYYKKRVQKMHTDKYSEAHVHLKLEKKNA